MSALFFCPRAVAARASALFIAAQRAGKIRNFRVTRETYSDIFLRTIRRKYLTGALSMIYEA